MTTDRADRCDDSSRDDAKLVEDARSGSTSSFAELVRRYQVPLIAFLRRHVSDSDVEDLAQDAFLRAWEYLDHFDGRCRFSTWLFTIARRLGINLKRKRRPELNSDQVEAARGSAPSPEQALADKERRENLWSVAERVLNDEQNIALWLHYAEGWPLAEIAAVLEISAPAVKAQLFRSRGKLRTALSTAGSSSDGRDRRLLS